MVNICKKRAQNAIFINLSFISDSYRAIGSVENFFGHLGTA